MRIHPTDDMMSALRQPESVFRPDTTGAAFVRVLDEVASDKRLTSDALRVYIMMLGRGPDWVFDHLNREIRDYCENGLEAAFRLNLLTACSEGIRLGPEVP